MNKTILQININTLYINVIMKNYSTFSGIIFKAVVLIFVSLSQGAFAQIAQLKYTAASYTGNIQNGPVASELKAQFVNNIWDTTPPISVTASFSDQQFTNVAGDKSLNGNFFGGTANADAKKVNGLSVWGTMNIISDPSNEMFTSNPFGTAGNGMDVASNHGFNIFTTVEPLYEANKDRGGRYYYSTLTLTFNRAISNPVLHVEGLGAFTKVDGKILGYSTELELQNVEGITMVKLSGSDALKVDKNKILNGKTQIDAYSDQSAATGSIRVTGTNITKLVFKIYLKGDNLGTSWSAPDFFAGDQWLLGVSMNSAVISGNVYDDANGIQGIPAAVVDGQLVVGTDIDSEITGDQAIYANLVNSANQIVKIAAVARDGAYVFQDVTPAKYSIVLTQDKNSATAKLPQGWIYTGEVVGTAGGHDGDSNGILNNLILTSATTTINNANFGINKIPSVDGKSQFIAKPEAGKSFILNGGENTPALTGRDYEDGVLGQGSKLVITKLPAGGDLLYQGNKVTTNTPIENFAQDKLQLVITSPGSNNIEFDYTFMDRAGKTGVPATYEFIWSNNTVPVTVVRFSAEKVAQTALLSWATNTEKNNNPFEIEHSIDSKEWETIGTEHANVEGHVGTEYSFVHEKPAAGANSYRLKMIDTDGKYTYSAVKNVNFEKKSETVIYPNPAVDVVNIQVDGTDDISSLSSLKIYDTTGKLVLSPALTSGTVDVNALKNGFYVVQILKKNGQVASSKMSIQK
jgi:hypothetical protein